MYSIAGNANELRAWHAWAAAWWPWRAVGSMRTQTSALARQH